MAGLFGLRILHWGPLLGFFIIKFVSLTVLYMTNIWLPMTGSFTGLINYLFYLSLVGLTLYHFTCAIFIGPGYVPESWAPPNVQHTKYLQFCAICQSFKCPRAHHCRNCNRCILKMDHHCPWINNCVGLKNHSNFTLFLASAVLGGFHSTFLLSMAIYRGYHAAWYYHNVGPDTVVFLSFVTFLFSVFSIGLSVGVIIAVGGLLYIQMNIILKNQTSIEDWIVTKAEARQREDTFIFPYDLGYKHNFLQVFIHSKSLDGITWPIRDTCNQYSLTYEQLVQKKEKRERARRYRAIATYNGNWFPLLSQGWRTCYKFPCSDETRIPLNEDDIISVTRWKKYWLYGEKICPEVDVARRLRGWFPRQCVVEILDQVRRPGRFSSNSQTQVSGDSLTKRKVDSS